MARYIELPDGSALELKEGQSPVEGMMAARQLFPELFKKEDPINKYIEQEKNLGYIPFDNNMCL